MFDPIRFLTPGYLFSPNPSHDFDSYWLLLTLFGLILAAGLVIFIALRVRKYNPPLKRLLRPLPAHLVIFALIGTFLVLFRLSEAYYLSMRFWLLVWGGVFVWYLIMFSRKVRAYPAELQTYLQKNEEKRYVVPTKAKSKSKKTKK